MLKKLLEKIIPQPKIFTAIQVEVSTTCNIKCVFCPANKLPHQRGNKFMPLELFKKLQPHFKSAELVYLQGWGEPLLSPHLWDMISLIKKERGTHAGFTTNGTLLTDKNIERIVSLGVYLVSISIAGYTEETHQSLRCGSELKAIIENVQKLVKYKSKKNSDLPKVGLSYMMTKESVKELPEAVKMAYEVGVDDIYATNLDYVFDEEVDRARIFSWEDTPSEEYQNIIAEAKEFAESKKFSFRPYPLVPEEKAVCELDPNKFTFITVDGMVTPCTYLGREKNPRWFRGQYYEYPRLSFGSIKEEDFMAIWNKVEYKRFREKFLKRMDDQFDIEYFILDRALKKEEDASYQKEDNEFKHPLPETCVTCPKAFGV